MELHRDGRILFIGTGGRDFDPALPTLVLIHGAGLDHTVWAQQARALAHHGCNVLALDLPGHGRSAGPPCDSIVAMAESVLAMLDACGVGSFRVAGHSMGALVAYEAAALAGSRAEAAVLIGFAPAMRVHPGLLAAARAGEPAAIEMMVSWGFGRAGQLGGNPAAGLWIRGAAVRLLERALKSSLYADLAACDGYDAALRGAVPACPVRLLLGAADRMTPPAAAVAFASRLRNAHIDLLPDTGHIIMLEAPMPTLAALKEVSAAQQR